MKLNKSPGIDGLTVKFYRTFWESIKYLIVFILNKCHEDRQLSFSQRTSIVVAINYQKGIRIRLTCLIPPIFACACRKPWPSLPTPYSDVLVVFNGWR
jgi:hypothetical protein